MNFPFTRWPTVFTNQRTVHPSSEIGARGLLGTELRRCEEVTELSLAAVFDLNQHCCHATVRSMAVHTKHEPGPALYPHSLPHTCHHSLLSVHHRSPFLLRPAGYSWDRYQCVSENTGLAFFPPSSIYLFFHMITYGGQINEKKKKKSLLCLSGQLGSCETQVFYMLERKFLFYFILFQSWKTTLD